MSRAVFRLVLLVSCAHALVHVFELSLPASEQLIGAEFHVERKVTGLLGMVWRLPFGLGAIFAGLLADRYGSKRMLILYLLGCAATAVATYLASSLALVFAAMFAMGCFASVYHPVGLALISRETSIENRGAALGWHGILGSLGIASAPFAAGLAFSTDAVTWRDYYLLLVVPAVALAVTLAFRLTESRQRPAATIDVPADSEADDPSQWRLFAVLVSVGFMMGLTYASFVHFLPRYLDEAGLRPSGVEPASFRNYLTAVVMLCAVVGQGTAGRIARPDRLELTLSAILFANAPLLVWMSLADGVSRFFATCTMALVHFMHQPIYNSLVAKYVPRSRRSLGYGISHTLGLGLGALGPAIAGWIPTLPMVYAVLAVVAIVAGSLSLVLTLSGGRFRTAP